MICYFKNCAGQLLLNFIDCAGEFGKLAEIFIETLYARDANTSMKKYK
jgi:hypothetical protein